MPTTLPKRRTHVRQSASESSIGAQIAISVALCLRALLCMIIVSDTINVSAPPPDGVTEIDAPS